MKRVMGRRCCHTPADVPASRDEGSGCAATTPELCEPGQRPQTDPDRRQENVEDDIADEEDDPPEPPAPQRDAGLRGQRAACAFASPARSSTTRRMRWAVSSIESSE